MLNDIKQFLTKDNLFDPIPSYESILYIPLLIFFGLLILFALLYLFLKGDAAKVLLRKYYFCFLTTGICGYLYLFGRYEGLAWLGAGITLVVIVIMFVLWLIYNTIITLRYIPKYQKEKTVTDIYEKYLPKPAAGQASRKKINN